MGPGTLARSAFSSSLANRDIAITSHETQRWVFYLLVEVVGRVSSPFDGFPLLTQLLDCLNGLHSCIGLESIQKADGSAKPLLKDIPVCGLFNITYIEYSYIGLMSV